MARKSKVSVQKPVFEFNAKVDDLNLADPAHLSMYKELISNRYSEYQTLQDRCKFSNFLFHKKKSALSYDQDQIFDPDYRMLRLFKNTVICSGHSNDYSESVDNLLDLSLKNISLELVSGLYLTNYVCFKSKSFGFTLLKNADQDVMVNSEYFIPEFLRSGKLIKSESFPGTSFNCLSRFFSSTEQMLNHFISGKLYVVDYTLDSVIPYSSKEEKFYKIGKSQKLTPPDWGYTAMYSGWHRTGNVLLIDDELEMCIVLGQDEGSFFGCELPEYCYSVKQALKCLMPPEVQKFVRVNTKEAKEQKNIRSRSCQRQGEWFFVPVDESVVPMLLDRKGNFTSITLPLESEDSNPHYIECYNDGCFDKHGQIYIKGGSVGHDNHETLNLEGWHTVYRNTALRSFSEQGVD